MQFQVFEFVQEPGRFVLWEIFENQEALDAHMGAAHSREYFASGLVFETDVLRHRLLPGQGAG